MGLDEKAIQKMFDNEVEAKRAETMKTSEQLMLTELIAKLMVAEDPNLPIVFDSGEQWPMGVDSWRGSYRELAIEYTNEEEKLTVAGLLGMLVGAIGETFQGYKGGDYLVGKNTPLWVASYGHAQGFKSNENGDYQAVVSVEVRPHEVAIITELMDY